MTDLTPFGWAPGGYTINCADCPPNTQMDPTKTGAKRSWRCEEHARERADDRAYAGVIGMQPFNLNTAVLVKLNDKGLAILRERHEQLAARVPSIGAWTPPRKDARGYTSFQLWVLMETFGPHISIGMAGPFETEILVPKDPK